MDNFTKLFGDLDIKDGDYLSMEYIKRDGCLVVVSGVVTFDYGKASLYPDRNTVWVHANPYTVNNIRKIIRWEAYN